MSLSVTCDRLVVFSGYSGFSTNKTDRNNITEILLKVALNTIKPNQTKLRKWKTTNTTLPELFQIKIKKSDDDGIVYRHFQVQIINIIINYNCIPFVSNLRLTDFYFLFVDIICYSAIRQGIQCDIPVWGSIFPEGIYIICRECHIIYPVW